MEPYLPEYSFGSKIKGKVMVAIFPDNKEVSENEALALMNEKERIESSFLSMGYETYSWPFDLKKVVKKTFFEEIQKVAGELPESESFAMIVKCSQQSGKLRMTSGELFDMENIYLRFNAKSCHRMKCKPKFFVFDTHPYQDLLTPENQDIHPSGVIKPPKTLLLPVTVPLEADMLVVYSLEDKGVLPRKSVFVDVLTKVLENNFKKENGYKDILELMVDVSSECYEKNVPGTPLPVVLSTLNSQYYIIKNNLGK